MRTTLLTLTLLLSIGLHAQTLNWKAETKQTYIYEITSSEAEQFVRFDSKDSLLIKNMLHTPRGSFVGEWKEQPKQGHFIFVEIENGQVHYRYTPIIPFKIFLFQEYGALTVQVIDAQGNIRSDANLIIRHQVRRKRSKDISVPFDKKTHTYTLNGYNNKANETFMVELDGFRALFELQKNYGRPQYGSTNGSDSYAKFYSYLITDKNRYKPGETIRFKSYSLYGIEDVTPVKDPLEIWMQTGYSYKFKKIDTISPYRPGGYAGEIVLHDSLQLTLDQIYTFRLCNKEGKVVASTNFKYEDYTLHDSKLEISLPSKHYAPHTQKLEIKVLDMNGLFLQDLQAEITVKWNTVLKAFTDLLQLPNPLMSKKIDLENEKPTFVEIPADIFGASNCAYSVEVKVLTHDNQLLALRSDATFYNSSYEIVTSTRNDTVCFQWYELGEPKKMQAEFSLNNSDEWKTIEFPFEIPFNQSDKNYSFRIDSLNFLKSFSTVNLDKQLNVTGGFKTDSLNIKLVNPLKLDISWYIYQGNLLLAKGSGTAFDTLFPKTNLNKVHYVDFFYHVGGTEQTYRRTFTPNIDFLDVSIDLPERIYPGQTIDATISVKDIWGKPVKDVDLTAFAYNSSLKYYVYDLPDYSNPPKKRERRANYSLQNKNRTVSVPFNYTYWNKELCLDTMPYYRFTFPYHKMFVHKVNTPDSTTQVAPFVMKNGMTVDIYVIEINDKPVYFSWTNQPKRYAFLVSDMGKQKITLRLHDRAIILDSLFFERGKKTILSIDMDSLPPKANTIQLNTSDQNGKYSFTNEEKKTYKSYISQFPAYTRNSDFLYFIQGNTKYPIYHPCYSTVRGRVTVGPLPEGYMEFGDIRYRHEGGFSYNFEENVVYKYPLETCPEHIRFSSNYNILEVNDFALTQEVFDRMIENCPKVRARVWYPRKIQILENKMIQIDLDVPIHPDSIGTTYLQFRNVETHASFFYRENQYNPFTPATYDLFLFYDDGSYIHFDSLTLNVNSYTILNMTHLPLHAKDSLFYFSSHTNISDDVFDDPKKVVTHTKGYSNPTRNAENYGASTIKGRVKDMYGNAVPYLQLFLKQEGRTVNGAMTDEQGMYQIFGIAAGTYDITAGGTMTCSSTYAQIGIPISGSEVKFIDHIINCSPIELETIEIVYRPPIFDIDNTTSTMKLSADEVRKNPGRSMAGASEASSMTGVMYDESYDELRAAEERLYYEIMQLNSLRSNFSDVGFWEPRLYTDQQGEAKFTVTFPDNITQWSTVVYAMNSKLQTATLRKNIQSYKPLMAELRNPQFLVEGDTSYYAGNIRNYTQDKEISGAMRFIVGEDTVLQKEISFTSSHQDKMQVTTSLTDSLTTTYLFQRNDGYTDGEKRTILVIPRGTEIADGTLQFLKPGDTKTVSAGQNEEINITLTASPLDVYLNTTYYLQNYRYDCNEQLASKLIGLLSYKLYQQYAGDSFKADKQIEKIIARLIENRNGNNLWSWWDNSPNSNYWMSAHILRALIAAQKAGYKVNLYFKGMVEDYVNTLSYRAHSLNDIEIINALSGIGAQQNYAAALELFDKEIAQKEHIEDSIARANKTKRTISYLNQKLLLLEIRQQQKVGYASDSIQKYLKTDILGAVYCDDEIEQKWRNNTLINTLIAYRIISKDTTLQHLKEAMQLYILRTKDRGWNTYQAASTVMTILPDLLDESANKEAPSTVILSGKESRELSEFPYKTTLYAGERLDIYMTSGIPLIYSDYQLKRVTTEHTGEGFKIETHINKDSLIAGEQSTLLVTLQVKQANAEHVMIEIPIPAGCSYASKNTSRYYNYETHREYFKDRVVIFCEKIPIGNYGYIIDLLPRFSGNYHLNPAKVEMMYFPVIYSNNDESKIMIR